MAKGKLQEVTWFELPGTFQGEEEEGGRKGGRKGGKEGRYDMTPPPALFIHRSSSLPPSLPPSSPSGHTDSGKHITLLHSLVPASPFHPFLPSSLPLLSIRTH